MTTYLPIITDNPSHVFSCELGERFLTFHAKWNTRFSHWTIDIADEDNNLLIAGMVLAIGGNLLAPFQFGIGGLFVVNSAGSTAEPTLENIGKETFLIYFPEGEIPSFPL